MSAIDTDMIPMVVFELNKKEFGISVYASQEVLIPPKITEMPQTPEFVVGIINLRENIISIIDMRTLFNFSTKKMEDSKIIIVKIHQMEVGIVVDKVHEVIKVKKNQIEDVPNIANWQINKGGLVGIAKKEERIITLLNLDHILTVEELNQFIR